MIDWKMLIPVLVCGVVLGYHLGTTITQREVEELKEQHLQLVAQINQEANESYSKIADELKAKQHELARALSERDQALASGRALRADAGRLRDQLAAAGKSLRERPVPGAPAAPADDHGEQLARCVGLLAEGAGLAGEGAELSLRVAADKNAVGIK